jgi:hypothetical protein
VTTEVAAREGVDPIELEKPLYDIVDVDALEALVESAGRGPQNEVQITFTYYGYEVVDGTGGVTLTGSTSSDGAGSGSTDQTTTR